MNQLVLNGTIQNLIEDRAGETPLDIITIDGAAAPAVKAPLIIKKGESNAVVSSNFYVQCFVDFNISYRESMGEESETATAARVKQQNGNCDPRDQEANLPLSGPYLILC